MRLLSIRSFQLCQFNDEGKLPPYAILSHTWGDEEVTFSDLERETASHMSGYPKIRKACEQALIDGLEYIWIDTCCIDKSSSAELSEAINSMFRWYECSAACYAYLEDVFVEPADPEHFSNSQHSKVQEALKRSRWFTRGWTLQELIAPNEVYFYNHAWKFIGTRTVLCSCIENITSIHQDVLADHHRSIGQGTIGPFLARKSVAQRMAWAANRETTRPEDMAYSLLGIFDLHMPLIYGEGVNKAFTRLQAEILRDSADHSILAWSTESSIMKSALDQPHPTPSGPINPQEHITVALASQPKLFALCKNIATISVSDARPIEMTSRGIRIDLRLIPDFTQRNVDYYYGALACHEEDDFATYGGIPLLQYHGQKDNLFRDPRRSLVKVPVAVAEHAPLRTVYLATKANLYPTSDALRYAVPQHFLLRHTEEDGMQDWEIHAQPADRWNQVTRTMQFRGIGARQRRGVLTIRANTRDKTHSFSFIVAFGIQLNARNETSGDLNDANNIYRPHVRLFHRQHAELDDDEWFGATTDVLEFREHRLRVYVKHEILFAKPVFVLQLRLRRRPPAVPETALHVAPSYATSPGDVLNAQEIS